LLSPVGLSYVILKYSAPAVQLGLTVTPKRKDNVDTYAYFGEPIYVYSLKDGINVGFHTPLAVWELSRLNNSQRHKDEGISEWI
jgi:type I site-specific restriction endonuclease